MPESLLCLAQFPTQLLEIVAGEIPQLHTFQVVPHSFVRVQLRGIGRKPLQMEPLGGPSGQVLLDNIAPVDGRTVPEHQHLAADMMPQMPEEPNHLGAAEGGGLHLHVQLPVGSDAADGRQVVPSQSFPQYWGFPPGGEGADHRRQQIESRLVYEDDGALLLFGFF